MSRKLNTSTSTDHQPIGTLNGFELCRQLNKANVPIRKDASFHSNLAIQNMGNAHKANFSGTYHKMTELDKAVKSFKETTGETCPQDLLALVLYAFCC